LSETDSFIKEVTEEVRQDRMFALWKKWGPLIVGAVVLVVALAAGWSWMRAQERDAAELRGGLFIAADIADVAAVSALTDQIDGPAQLLAELTAAAAEAESGETAKAAKRYAAIAGRDGVAPEYRDIAQLMAIRLGAEGIDADAMLDGLADGAGPYRLLARELRAAMRLQAGDTAAAHAELNAILIDPLATSGLRQRAVALLLATGGTIEAIDGGS